MTHGERVLTAIRRQQPDRVPLDLGSVGGFMVDEVYHGVRGLLRLDDLVKPYRSGSSANYYDERLLAHRAGSAPRPILHRSGLLPRTLPENPTEAVS